MEKIIIALLVVLQILLCNTKGKSQACSSQNLPCEYTANWDWLTDPNNYNGNWDAQLLSGTVGMTSPFYSGTPSDDIVRISDASDYLPQQGWVLLNKDFGCVPNKVVTAGLPWFMLYNKYRSIIRLFVYFGTTNPNNKASVLLKWSPLNSSTQINSLLTLSNNFPKANCVYSVTGTGNNEIMLNYLNHVPSNGGWEVTDFQVNFDPNTTVSVNNFQRINFEINVATSSIVGINGDFNFSTQSATAQEPPVPTTNTNSNQLLDFVVDAKKFLGKVPKVDELNSGFNNIVSGTDTINKLFHTEFTRNLKRVTDNLNGGDLKKYLIGTATVAEKILGNGYLSLAGSFLETFIGKSSTAAAGSNNYFIQPTVSKGSVSLTGTIVTEYTPKIISMQLPGTSHKFFNGNYQCLGIPVYDCPLGLVSVQGLPTLEMKKHKVITGTQNFFFCHNVGGQQAGTVCDDPASGNVYETYHSYKVTSNIEFAINAAVGVNIDYIKAALVALPKPNSSHPIDTMYKAIDNMSGNGRVSTQIYNASYGTSPLPPLAIGIGGPYTYTRKSLEQKLIENGSYLLNAMNVNTKAFSYSTLLVDISKFKNTVIVTQPNMRILLKVQVVMSPSNSQHDQTPIVYVLTYDLTDKITDVGDPNPSLNGLPPDFTCSQLEQLNLTSNTINGPQTINAGLTSGINLKTNNAVIVNANSVAVNNVSFKGANFVRMKPGFKANTNNSNYFKAYIDNTGQCANGTDALTINTYFSNCTISALDRIAQSEPNNEDEGTVKVMTNEGLLKMYIAPNPNQGNFKLLFNKNVEGGKIRIINMLNQEVYSQILEGNIGTHEVTLNGNVATGTYFLLWNNNEFTLTQKFILD